MRVRACVCVEPVPDTQKMETNSKIDNLKIGNLAHELGNQNSESE